VRISVGWTVMLALASCARIESPPASAEITSGRYAPHVTSDHAVMQLTTVRCEREVACNSVGVGRKFTNRDACARELGEGIQRDLQVDACARGIDGNKLSVCLALAREEKCGNFLESIDRAAVCSRAALCG